MSIFDKFISRFIKKEPTNEVVEGQENDLTPDQLFVKKFKDKGGKFLYCTKQEEVLEYLQQIFEENNWESCICENDDLASNLAVLNIPKDEKSEVFYTDCEHLIVEDGSLLFSSNQLKARLTHYPINFIVYATTSQLTHNKGEALTSIKYRFEKKIPSNISAIKDYIPHKKDPNFLNYGNTNSKNLYLLLLEDL